MRGRAESSSTLRLFALRAQERLAEQRSSSRLSSNEMGGCALQVQVDPLREVRHFGPPFASPSSGARERAHGQAASIQRAARCWERNAGP